MIVTLAGGTIGLYDGDNLVEQLFVVGGFAEVTPAGCTVLADEALPLEQVTADSLAQRERAAEWAQEAAIGALGEQADRQ